MDVGRVEKDSQTYSQTLKKIIITTETKSYGDAKIRKIVTDNITGATFTYIYNLTEDMHEVQYDGMLPIIADKAFNPLVEDAEAIFAQAVEVYKSKIAAKYAKE